MRSVQIRPAHPCKHGFMLRLLRLLLQLAARSVCSRRDLLDHVIVLNERQLKRLMSEYVRYYHDDRTHLALAGEGNTCGARNRDESQRRLQSCLHATAWRPASSLRSRRLNCCCEHLSLKLWMTAGEACLMPFRCALQQYSSRRVRCRNRDCGATGAAV